jgi:cytochrome oxidase Cu insertion factor (SCO1/SenC/PrrC family)
VSVQQPSVPAGGSPRRLRLLVWGSALAIGVLAGVLIVALRSPSHTTSTPRADPMSAGADATWPAGAKPAPDFRLTDQSGKRVSLARFRGRPVLLTFIDPLCRNLCPTEARTLERAQAQFPAGQRPAIVAVSVNQWGNARRDLRLDARKWKLTSDWHWGVGPAATLRRAWADYAIGVQDNPNTVAGITVHDITHTEATYLIDARGDQRALFLYPFRASVVAETVRRLGGA